MLNNLDSVAPRIESLFNGWSRKKIIKYIKQNDSLIDDILFDENNAVVEFKDAANPAIADAFEESGKAVLTDLGLDIELDLENTRARKFIGDKTEKFAKDVNKTTADELRKTLKEGFAEGESVPQLAKRIKKVYNKASTTRSVVIARTEIISSSNAGSLEGMKQSGVVKKKEWLSSRDSRVRESHLSPLDGQKVNLGGVFTSNDGNTAQYPGGFGVAEEDIQCRCTIVSVI